jgi:hypothetical protein
MVRILIAATVARRLSTQGARAVDWMINEDYKQLDARGASDFDILLQGDVAGQITGGGKSPVTNPFMAVDFDIYFGDAGGTTNDTMSVYVRNLDTNVQEVFSVNARPNTVSAPPM